MKFNYGAHAPQPSPELSALIPPFTPKDSQPLSVGALLLRGLAQRALHVTYSPRLDLVVTKLNCQKFPLTFPLILQFASVLDFFLPH